VGNLARKLFPGGDLIESLEIQRAIHETNECIEKSSVLFEGAFRSGDLLVRPDILIKRSGNRWGLIEVKSSTSVQSTHLHDVAFQKYVLEKCGLEIEDCSVMCLNKEYVLSKELEIDRLFSICNIDSELQGNDFNEKEINNFVQKISDAFKSSKEPEKYLGSVCKTPYLCPLKDSYCWKDLPSNSILFMSRISDAKIKKLQSKGLTVIDSSIPSEELTASQLVQVLAEVGETPIINRSEIKSYLNQLQFPLCYFDLETYATAIPEYDNCSPYENIPFQFSIHIQNNECDESELVHKGYLHNDESDPRQKLVEQLLSQIPSSGSIIVYNLSFERSRLLQLAELFPVHREALHQIASRLWDLSTPFSRRWYYDRKFRGSHSLKSVLPVLCPSLSYTNLEINRGDIAQCKYFEMRSNSNEIERFKIFAALWEYCKMDTLAMVHILQELRKIE
jgi:hypothetical protein